MPRQAPAERSRWTEAPGTNASSAASKRSLPRDCEKRWTLGVHPPDMRSRSQASFSRPRTRPLRFDSADLRRLDPEPSVRAAYAGRRPDGDTRVQRGRHSALFGVGRRSQIAAMVTPA